MNVAILKLSLFQTAMITALPSMNSNWSLDTVALNALEIWKFSAHSLGNGSPFTGRSGLVLFNHPSLLTSSVTRALRPSIDLATSWAWLMEEELQAIIYCQNPRRVRNAQFRSYIFLLDVHSKKKYNNNNKLQGTRDASVSSPIPRPSPIPPPRHWVTVAAMREVHNFYIIISIIKKKESKNVPGAQDASASRAPALVLSPIPSSSTPVVSFRSVELS